MQVIRDLPRLKEEIEKLKIMQQSIGLVPTMGFLHEGHLSLIREARRSDDVVVVSIFVNPIQFGEGEDYEDYPRDLEGDSNKAEKEGVDILFCPRVSDMYPRGYATYVEVERLTEGLCGSGRPGHFRGVTTVVNKLFNLVEPERAYFGQKDAQQALVIRKMAGDLNMNLEVKVSPTVREEDGLALSSRNSYLSSEERRAARVLYRALSEASDLVYHRQEYRPEVVQRYMEEVVEKEPLANLEYAEVVSGEDLSPLSEIRGKILLALAVKIGSTRLIDNMMLEV